MYKVLRQGLMLVNILIVLILMVGYLTTRFEGVISYSGLILITFQALLNVVFLKFKYNRLITFYIFIFTVYFLQNYIFMIPKGHEIDLIGEYYGISNLNIVTFERTIIYLGISHVLMLTSFLLFYKPDLPLVNPNFTNINKLVVLLGMLICILLIENILNYFNAGQFLKYVVEYSKSFFLSMFNVFLVVVTLFIMNIIILKKYQKIILIISSILAVAISTMNGARSGIAFFIFLVIINIFTENLKIVPKLKHLIWGLALFTLLIVQYQVGTIFRYKNSVNAQIPNAFYQLNRLSSRLSGINYVHLFLNYNNVKKQGYDIEQLKLDKRIKAGVNHFIKFRAYNEFSIALLFEYFYRENYPSISSSLEVYNSDMITLFGEPYLYTKNLLASFSIILCAAVFIVLIYNKINSLLVMTYFLFQFHELFINFGFIDWYFPDLVVNIISFIMILLFLRISLSSLIKKLKNHFNNRFLSV